MLGNDDSETMGVMTSTEFKSLVATPCPILERRSTILLLLLLCMYVCHAQATPSYIRKEKYNPATTTPMYVCMSRSGYPLLY